MIGKKVFSEFRFSLIDSTLSTSSSSSCRRFASTKRSTPAAPARWAIAAPGRSSWRRTSTSPSAASTRCAPAAVRNRLVGQQSAFERVWHLYLHQPRRLQCRPAGDLHDSRPAIRWSTTRRPKPAGSCRTTSARPDAAAELRLAAGGPDAGRFALELRAARGVHLERHEEDDRARRLRHLLRLVRFGALRADHSCRRHSPGRRDRSEPVVPGHRGRGHAAAGERHSRRLARAADHSAGLDRFRAAARAVGGLPHRLHVDARQQHAALGQRQCAGERRAAGSVGRQHHRDSIDRQARDRIVSPWRSTRATCRAAFSAW